MKKLSLLAAAGLCSLGFLTACSENGSAEAKVSKATECAAGISAECLAGTWTSIGLQTNDGVMSAKADYSAAPGKLTFTKEGKFSYEAPVNSILSSTCLKDDSENMMYGTWTLANGTLTLSSVSTCIRPSNATFTPTIKNENGLITMKFGVGKNWFTFNEGLDLSERSHYAETYTISAN